ncbi:MAG: glutamate racemase [Alphaproteobacteria bacterium]|nr:glutamate racemase [Alphaproteobacteria bacterium]
MKIGIFDSGLGGLLMMRAITAALDQYDYVYLGDTAYLPYGARLNELIYERTQKCIDWLMREQNCVLVIIACNTATIAALRQIQQEWLPAHFPDRRVLGIVVPTLECAVGAKNIGLIGTTATVASKVYEEELRKITPNAKIKSVATPLLVPLIENNGDKYARAILSDYLAPLDDVETLILGCTHYPIYNDLIRELMPHTNIISQDEILPLKLINYLSRHPEIECRLTQNSSQAFYVTDSTQGYINTANKLFDKNVIINKIII